MALIDDIADLLAIHNEVNAICGQRQEGIMDMGQLRKDQAILKHFKSKHHHGAMDYDWNYSDERREKFK